MTKVQGIWDEMAEDESRKVYDILGVYSLRIHTGWDCMYKLRHGQSSQFLKQGSGKIRSVFTKLSLAAAWRVDWNRKTVSRLQGI